MTQDKIWAYFQNEGLESFSQSRGRLEFLVRHLSPAARVLNVGVGNGVLESLAVFKGVDIWSLDPSERSIDRLRQSLGMGEKAQAGYSQAMPFADAHFDVVVMSEVLEHLDDAVLEATLDEVHRVLRAGGLFIGTVPARERLADSLVVCPDCGLQFHRWGHKNSFDIDRLSTILATRFALGEVSERFFIDWESVGWWRKLQGLIKKFLSWRGVGTYGLYRNFFFSVQKPPLTEIKLSKSNSGDVLEHESCTTHLRRLRRAEIDRMLKLLDPRRRVLELGGSDGFQAAILSSRGHDVTSLDVASPVPNATQLHPVSLYDGENIPYGDSSFNVVFSSNVLEHVRVLGALLRESSRVLEPGGHAIHILPSPAWRFWTSIAHYAHVAMRVLGMRRQIPGGVAPSVTETMQHKGFWYVIRRALVAGPHGEYPSAISELHYFSRRRWLRVFRGAGFEVIEVAATGLFYTGYGLLPWLSLRVREKMAKVLGSATYIYVLRKE